MVVTSRPRMRTREVPRFMSPAPRPLDGFHPSSGPDETGRKVWMGMALIGLPVVGAVAGGALGGGVAELLDASFDLGVKVGLALGAATGAVAAYKFATA